MSKKNIYRVGNRDIIGQCEDYVRHVDRMTAEGLHEKGDIAAELAHRDIKIRKLEETCIYCYDAQQRGEKRISELEAHADALSGELELAKNVIEELQAQISLAHALLAYTDCFEWCGKSPTKHSDGKCPICRIRTALEGK